VKSNENDVHSEERVLNLFSNDSIAREPVKRKLADKI
jgi:hypothetical protein